MATLLPTHDPKPIPPGDQASGRPLSPPRHADRDRADRVVTAHWHPCRRQPGLWLRDQRGRILLWRIHAGQRQRCGEEHPLPRVPAVPEGHGVMPYRKPFRVRTHSYHYWLTRLETTGTVSIKRRPVHRDLRRCREDVDGPRVREVRSGQGTRSVVLAAGHAAR